MATAFMRHKTSPRPGDGTGISFSSILLKAVSILAFMVFGIIIKTSYLVEKI